MGLVHYLDHHSPEYHKKMWTHYFKIWHRSLKKQPVVSAINLIGLVICLWGIFFISAYVLYELRYDTTHPNSHRIYRIVEDLDSGSHIERSSSAPIPLGRSLALENEALIEDYVRIFDFQQGAQTVKMEDNELFTEPGIYWVDSTIFDFWDIDLVMGSAEEALAKPGSITLSESLAKKWFGNENPLGKVVQLQRFTNIDLEVTGVFSQSNPSHFKPNAMISFSNVAQFAPTINQNWVWNPVWTYVKLASGIQPEQLIAQFPEFVQGHFHPAVKDVATLDLQPIGDIHLHSDREFEMGENSKMIFVSIFLLCGLFLFIVGSVNFVNLTSAMFLVRSREMAVRKVLGANQKILATQIAVESTLSVCFAILLAFLVLGYTLQPALQYLGLNFEWAWFQNPVYGITFAAIGLLIAIASSAYPAIVFSKSDVQKIFKQGTLKEKGGGFFRNGLIVLQFGVSLLLMVFSVSSYQQVDFMQNKSKGYSAENVVTLDVSSTAIQGNPDGFCQALTNLDYVKNAALMNEYIGVNNNNHEFRFGDMAQGEWKYLPALMINEPFLDLFEIELLAGRDYDLGMPREDSLSVIINRSMAKVLGFQNPEEALGIELQSLAGMERVIGVVEDFHYKSLHHDIGPMVLEIASRSTGHFNFFTKYVAVNMNEISPEAIAEVEELWKQNVANKPFDYRVLSDIHASTYARDELIGTVLLVFTIITWLVAIFGLLALSLFNSRLQMKEIAIRRILGAEVIDVLLASTKKPILLILFSLLWAGPVSFLIVKLWISNFAYHISYPVSWLIFISLILVLMAVITSFLGASKVLRIPPARVVKEQ